MRFRTLATMFVLSLAATNSFAQKGAEDGSKYGHGQDSINCLRNLSIYSEYVKTENYKDAYLPWKAAFEECPKLVDSLKGRRPIIINLEKLETEVARKIFDFMSGATYALNGNVQKVANNIFIFAPENVGISASSEDRTSFEFGAEEKSPWR